MKRFSKSSRLLCHQLCITPTLCGKSSIEISPRYNRRHSSEARSPLKGNMLKLHLKFYFRKLLLFALSTAFAIYIAFTSHLLFPSRCFRLAEKRMQLVPPNWLISNRNQRFCENLIFHSDAPSSLHRSARAIHCLFCFAFHYQSLSIESTRRCLKLTYYLFLPSIRKHKWKLLMLCDAFRESTTRFVREWCRAWSRSDKDSAKISELPIDSPPMIKSSDPESQAQLINLKLNFIKATSALPRVCIYE